MTFLFETLMEVHTSEYYSSLEIQSPFSLREKEGVRETPQRCS